VIGLNARALPDVPAGVRLAAGPDTAEWAVWSTTARLVVTDGAALADARTLVESVLAQVDQACGPGSELARHPTDRPSRVSPLLAELVRAALAYDRAIAAVRDRNGHQQIRPAPGWRRVRLDGRLLTVPRNTVLDLGATARAFAADRCAQLVHTYLRVGVLVSLGRDIATAGPAPRGGWCMLIQDQPGDPACTVHLPAGAAIVTSSTAGRTWRRGGRALRHVLDPRTCQPVMRTWRTASVVAGRCVDANMASTAALVLGADAPAWLRINRVPARLVAADGRVLTQGGWPE
jgi:FAD:protein FMN transferase